MRHWQGFVDCASKLTEQRVLTFKSCDPADRPSEHAYSYMNWCVAFSAGGHLCRSVYTSSALHASAPVICYLQAPLGKNYGKVTTVTLLFKQSVFVLKRIPPELCVGLANSSAQTDFGKAHLYVSMTLLLLICQAFSTAGANAQFHRFVDVGAMSARSDPSF